MEKKNKFGTLMRIIKVLPKDKIIVQFQDEFACTKEIHWNNFKSGNVKNPYDRTNGGVGYIGEGKYKSKYNDRNTRAHNTWNDMLSRCYKEQSRFKYSAYKECTVCEEWHNFQNFSNWYEKNYYDYSEGRLHLDKDIIKKNNTVYSPEFCLLVPQRINMIFMKKPNSQCLPSGIKQNKSGYVASYNGKQINTFKTLEEAVNAHDTAKMVHVNNVAEEYKNKISTKVYKALIKHVRDNNITR